MIDQGIIDTRVSKVRAAAEKLKRFQKFSLEEFTGNSDNLDIAERNLEVAIEAMLDIGNHIIAVLGYEKPENYYDIFLTLGKRGVLDNTFAEKIAPLAGLRNRIIHDYTEIDHSLVLENIRSRLSDFEDFCRQVLSFTAKL